MADVIGYKMTHDNGFAPNPFHGYLTLATCKPRVRHARAVGDWVAGFASKALVQGSGAAGLGIPYQGLIHLMRVAEVVAHDDYFKDPRFVKKKPTLDCGTSVERCGDNIYYGDCYGGHQQLPNKFHAQGDLYHDTDGKNVLIATEFYYFGRNCFVPDGGWTHLLGEPLSEGRTFRCPPTFVGRLLGYFAQRGVKPGVRGLPCGWGPDIAELDPVVPACTSKPSSSCVMPRPTRDRC